MRAPLREESAGSARAVRASCAGLKTASRVLLSLVVAVLLVAALMFWGGVAPAELARAWRGVAWPSLAAAFAVYALQYVLRAWRFHVLVPRAERPSFACSLAVTSAYGMASLILPAKLGEATFVVYLNRAGRVSAPVALAALVVGRLLDLASLCLGFGSACLVLACSGAVERYPWLWPAAGALLAASVFLFALSARGDRLVALAARASALAGLARFERGRKLLSRAQELGGALRSAAGEGRLVAAAALSLPMWACVFVFCALLAHGFGLPSTITFAEASFGASLAILTSVVPISAFANFGTLETGWVLGFGLFGVSRELALATGTGLHLAQLAFAVVLGLAGHAGMGLVARELRSE